MNVTCPNCATIYRVDPAKVPEAGVRARCAVCNAVFPIRREMESTPKAEPVGTQQARTEPVRQDPPRPEPRSEPKPQPAPTPPPAREPVRAEPVRTQSTPAAPPSMPPGSAPRPAAPSRPANPFTRPAVPITGSPGAVPATPVAPAAPVRPAAPPPPSSTGAPPAAPGPKPAGTPVPASPPARPAGAPGVRPPNPFLSQDPALKAKRLARALISDMVVYHPGKRQEGLRDGNLKELFEEEIKKSWEEYAEQVGREVAESTTYFREALNEILAGGRQVF
jgi:predicted Zn finger-like uncharacterized protein